MRRKNAFTLVELLVVIGIIALLISILLPALSKAREAANKAACLSNMRQLHAAMAIYASEWRDRIPIGYLSYKQNAEKVYIDSGPAGPPMPGGVYVALGILHHAGLMKNPQVYYCPSESDPRWRYDTVENPWIPAPQIGPGNANNRLGYCSRPVLNWPTMSMRAPEGLALFPPDMRQMSKMRNLAILSEGYIYPPFFASRHKSGVNVLFGNGSAHFVSLKSLPSLNSFVLNPGNGGSINDQFVLDDTVTPNKGVWGEFDRN